MKNKVHILFFSKEGRGGIETFLNQMSQLNKQQYILKFAFYKKDKFKKYGKNDIFLGINYPKEVNFSFRKVQYFFENVKKTIRLVKIEKPDIIFAVDIYSLILLSSIKLFKLVNVKYVALVNTHIYHILNTLRPNFFYRKFLINAFRLVAGSPDKYVFTSSGLRDNIISNLSVPKEKTIVISHSVNIEKVRKLKNEKLGSKEMKLFSKNNFNLITVGRLEDQKDFKTILSAFSEVLKKIPMARLFVIGDGQMKRELVNFAKDLKVNSKVYFLGWKRNIYKYLSRSDIFLFSSFYEGFSMVIVEAMACGLPVIATDTLFGPGEILNKGKYGKIIKVGDYTKMAEEAIKMNKSLEARKFYGAGKSRVWNYDTKIMLKKFDHLFSSIILKK